MDRNESSSSYLDMDKWRRLFQEPAKFKLLQELIVEYVETDVDGSYSGHGQVFFPEVHIAWRDICPEAASMVGVVYTLDIGESQNFYGIVEFSCGKLTLLRSVGELKIKIK